MFVPPYRALYNLTRTTLWLSMRLDTVTSFAVLGTAMLCVGLRDDLEPSEVGLAISNSIQQLVFLTLIANEMSEGKKWQCS